MVSVWTEVHVHTRSVSHTVRGRRPTVAVGVIDISSATGSATVRDQNVCPFDSEFLSLPVGCQGVEPSCRTVWLGPHTVSRNQRIVQDLFTRYRFEEPLLRWYDRSFPGLFKASPLCPN